jgi:hypothetical protein
MALVPGLIEEVFNNYISTVFISPSDAVVCIYYLYIKINLKINSVF